jgi:hypothetical protein
LRPDSVRWRKASRPQVAPRMAEARCGIVFASRAAVSPASPGPPWRLLGEESTT